MATRVRTLATAVVLFVAAVPAMASAQANPRISPKDVLAITVVNVPDWSREYPVSSDGSIEFPQIGRVVVGDKTSLEVASEITKRLIDNKIMVRPQVTIDLKQTPNKRVNVSGLVRVPGPVLYAGEITVLDAILKAGGRQPESADEVLVVRMGPDGSPVGEPLKVNIREIENGNLEPNITLQDGDQVFVVKAQGVYVTGEVRSPNAYNIEAGMSVRQVITLAGGYTERAAKNRIEIKRMVDGKEKTIKVKESDIVKPGDTIVVQRRRM